MHFKNVPLKRKRENHLTQRSWSYLADMEWESYATADSPVSGLGGTFKGKSKGKPPHKGKDKGKGKGKGKSKDKGKPHVTFAPWKGNGKGKCKIPFKGSRSGPITPQSTLSIPQRPTDNSSTQNTASMTGASSQPI
jgi:hypothetical protein